MRLVEQAHVLDRDHRLVGEGLEQGNLPLGKAFNRRATEIDRADRDTFSQQGDAELRPTAMLPRELAGHGILVRLDLHVSYVDGLPVERRPAVDRPTDQGDGELADGPGGIRP